MVSGDVLAAPTAAARHGRDEVEAAEDSAWHAAITGSAYVNPNGPVAQERVPRSSWAMGRSLVTTRIYNVHVKSRLELRAPGDSNR